MEMEQGLSKLLFHGFSSAGGDFLDADGKAVFNSDAGVKVVNFIKELVNKGSNGSDNYEYGL